MADLTQYLTQKYTKMITEITTDLGKTADDPPIASSIADA